MVRILEFLFSNYVISASLDENNELPLQTFQKEK
jgi:hypothetical protein